MKKIICLACILAFFVVGDAGAVPQNVTLGPYNMTFDIGFDEPINGSCMEVVLAESYDGSKYNTYEFRSGDGVSVSMDVMVTPGKQWMRFSADHWEDVVSSLRLNGMHATAYPRVFGDDPGHVLVVKDPVSGDEAYAARYVTLNRTADVSIFSGYPWDEGTTNLLNSIHIEKAAI